jgi:hypothetical protein
MEVSDDETDMPEYTRLEDEKLSSSTDHLTKPPRRTSIVYEIDDEEDFDGKLCFFVFNSCKQIPLFSNY